MGFYKVGSVGHGTEIIMSVGTAVYRADIGEVVDFWR